MGRYTFINYIDLVSMWYNEFLPSIAGNKAMFVKDAGIVYLNSIPLETHRAESVKFLAGKIIDGGNMDDSVKVFVQEPKPVNNPRVQCFLDFIGRNKLIADERKSRIFHLANKRYSISSRDVLITQDKEIGEFLDCGFTILRKLNLRNCRFYSSSLPFKDVVDTASDFFPKRSMSVLSGWNTGDGNRYIKVESTNSLISSIANLMERGNLMNGGKVSQSMSLNTGKYMDMTIKSLIRDIETMIV